MTIDDIVGLVSIAVILVAGAITWRDLRRIKKKNDALMKELERLMNE